MSMFSVIQVNRIYLIFNPVHFLVDSSDFMRKVNVPASDDLAAESNQYFSVSSAISPGVMAGRVILYHK